MTLRFVAVQTLILLVCVVVFSASEEIKAKPGDNVLLQCRGPRDAAVLEWTRPDLKSDDYVFFVRENRTYENFQHSSFRGRVELSDPKMKDGDGSVILKNVTINDTGTYECRVGYGGSSKSICNITLNVTDSDLTAGHTQKEENEDGRNRLGLGLSLVLVGIAVFSVIFVICKSRMKQDSVVPPSDEEAHLQPA